jgi:hypothetical protein
VDGSSGIARTTNEPDQGYRRIASPPDIVGNEPASAQQDAADEKRDGHRSRNQTREQNPHRDGPRELMIRRPDVAVEQRYRRARRDGREHADGEGEYATLGSGN